MRDVAWLGVMFPKIDRKAMVMAMNLIESSGWYRRRKLVLVALVELFG